MNYLTEKTTSGIELNRKNVQQLEIVCTQGLCKANYDDQCAPRDVVAYEKNVLVPGMARGEIGDGVSTRFDDRKMQYHSSAINQNKLVVSLGFSHYKEFLAQFKGTNESREEYQERLRLLKEKGIKDFNEEFAYFSRAPGVAVIPITSNGSVVVGERSVALEEGKKDDYQGLLQGAHGHIDFRADPAAVNILEDVVRELHEEMGVGEENVRHIQFVGVYSNPDCCGADLDFAHLVFTNLPDEYFSSGEWMKHRLDKEHGTVFLVKGYAEVQRFLAERKLRGSDKRWELLYSLEATLESITLEELS